ncbi:MAG: S8 family serine peptidase [Alphaproteobacteria bacterium]|nr:S8 family serine peptidase [Alphaproteobacteria bacterium]
MQRLDDAGTVYLLSFAAPQGDYAALRQSSLRSGMVVSLEPQVPKPANKRQSLPADPLFGRQWHLRNTGQFGGTPGVDLNVTRAWQQKKGTAFIDGSSVNVGIVDDGVDFKHWDLDLKYRPTMSRDVLAGGPIAAADFPPRTSGAADCVDFNGDGLTSAKWCHGTAVAGIIAAIANNGAGGVGVAHGVRFGDIRLLYGAKTDVEESSAIGFRTDVIAIKNNSWGPCDNGANDAHYQRDASTGQFIFDYAHHNCFAATAGNSNQMPARILPVAPGAAMKSALRDAATLGRSGRGSVIIWAAGNGALAAEAVQIPGQSAYLYQEDWGGYDGWACSRFVIGVGSVNNLGKRASYSERGPCHLVVAPVGGFGEGGGSVGAGIVTTDLIGSNNGYSLTGSYTVANHNSAFNGTSAAAPMMAGVAALMLQMKPTLTYRDVMHILVRTAKLTDPTNTTWKNNGAGRHVSYDYGFGLIDANAAVSMARTWTAVAPQVSFSKLTSGSTTIPSNSAIGATFGMLVTDRIKVEHVEVVVGALHTKPGQLEVRLRSPSGTVHVLGVPQAGRPEEDLFYMFTTPHFWDEQGDGLWQVTVANKFPGGTGTLNTAKINVYGTPY